MVKPAVKRATYEDVLNAPRHMVAEILFGTLRTHPRPAPRHTLASSRLGSRLGRAFDEGIDGPGGWWILDEPEVHLGEHVLVPDLAGWRTERLPELPETAFFATAPDWICEVLSPSTEAEDRAEKLPVYAEFEVQHAWLVDPKLRTVEVFRREDRQWLLLATHRDDAVVRAEPFDAIEFSLSALWARPSHGPSQG